MIVVDFDIIIQISSPLLMPSCSNTENISKIIQKISPLPRCSLTDHRKFSKNRSTETQVLTKSSYINDLKENSSKNEG